MFEDYIHVCGQFNDKYGYGPTKTKEKRNIPIVPFIREELLRLKELNGDGYLFSENGGISPVKRMKVYEELMTPPRRMAGQSILPLGKRPVGTHEGPGADWDKPG